MTPKYLRPSAVTGLLDQQGWEAVGAFCAENAFLLTGFGMPLHRNTNPRAPVAAFASRHRSVLVLPRIQLGYLAQHAPGELTVDGIVTFGEFDLARIESAPPETRASMLAWTDREARAASWSDAVHEAIVAVGADGGSIGCDDPPPSLRQAAAATSAREPSTLITDPDAFAELARAKNDAAVLGIERAARVAERALVEALEHVRPGLPEADLHDAYRTAVARQGGTAVHVGIGAGPAAVFPINRPSRREIGPDDLLKVDVGALVGGFFADTACVVHTGSPTRAQLAAYEVLVEAQARAVELVVPGSSTAAIFDAAVAVVKRAMPEYRRPHCGHGIGVQRYEAPLIAPQPRLELLTGDVVNIEVPYYAFGLGGFNIEDTLVVTADAARHLTTLPNELLPIGEWLPRAAAAADRPAPP